MESSASRHATPASARHARRRTRLAAPDVLLVLALVPIWAVAFGLHLHQVVRARLVWVPVFVAESESAATYPKVAAFRAGEQPEGIAVGDRLLRIGERNLAGVGPIGFMAAAYAEAGPDLSAPVLYERNGAHGASRIQLTRVRYAGSIAPFVAILAVTAVVVLVRVPRGAPIGRAFFLGAITYATHWSLFGGGPPLQTYAWAAVFFASSLVMFPLLIRAALLFPEDTAPPGRALPWWPWLFAVFGPLSMSWMFGTPLPYPVGQRGSYLVNVAFAGTYLVLLTRNYRRAGAVGRRQLKWVIYGLYVGLLPMFTVDLVTAVHPEWWWLHEIAPIALIPVPICLFIAIVRYNLFDIDRLISSTASYSILTVLVLAGGFALVPWLAGAASAATGVDSSSAQILVSVALATIVIPTHRALRPRIDRLFFPERHALQEGTQQLLWDISGESDPRRLTTLVGERLDALLRPETCVVYARAVPGYGPIFSRGRAVPPAFESHSPLVATLEVRAGLLVWERFARPGSELELSPFDRAGLDTLGVAVVVPVRRRGQLAAFLCFGGKQSGDIYTPTDLALLTAVADKMSTQLDRMDQEEVVRAAQAMQQELRRFVPGAIAQQVEAGADLQPRERPVSVLFVDIRGYSTYAESREAHEVFTTINRYTQTVSAIVEKLGGSVVEFNGDGMMAVFGAPTPLPDKERAAVSAGREIVSKVQALGGTDESETLSVGVGVATGSAFVGTIQAVDRLIWTALGNTTNLAARLQGLTRDLDAAMVIDLATWRAAGEPPEFELREQVPIRGRSQREDVYVLPLVAVAAP